MGALVLVGAWLCAVSGAPRRMPEPVRGQSHPSGRCPTLDSGGTGFFPYLESVYDGGGFTLGGGYRFFYAPSRGVGRQGAVFGPPLQARRGEHDVGRARGRPAILRARAGWRDAPQVGYYGSA